MEYTSGGDVLKILYDTDPKLHIPSSDVAEVDDTVRKFCRDMYATMIAYDGIGLAAAQVGKNEKIICIDHDYLIERAEVKSESSLNKLNKPMFLINAKVVSHSERTALNR